MNAIPRFRGSYAGPALFSYGFRPFFLLGGVYAAVAMLAWMPFFYDELTLATAFIPRDWHIHELLYGYLPAVITGFLLTAIPNWTGRLPLQGTPLLILVVVWVAGRIAVTFSAAIGPLAASLIDASFLFLIAAAAAREIAAGENWRNLRVLIPVMILAAGNVVFHVEAYTRGHADYGIKIGIAVIITLIMLIGGRVIPSFTHNWLLRENPGRLPSPFATFDAFALAFSVAALLLWIVFPLGTATGVALFAAGALQAIRLTRWAGDRTLRDRLVLVLHIAYAFVPLGFLLSAGAALGLLLPSAGLHAWMAGAAGMMPLAVMTRASLGHTGRTPIASVGTQTIYTAVFVAAIARIAAALLPGWSNLLLHLAGFGWIVAFGGFALVYGPILLTPQLRTRNELA